MRLIREYTNKDGTKFRTTCLDVTTLDLVVKNENKELGRVTVKAGDVDQNLYRPIFMHGLSAMLGDSMTTNYKDGTAEDIISAITARLDGLRNGELRTVPYSLGISPARRVLAEALVLATKRIANQDLTMETAIGIVKVWTAQQARANLAGCTELREEYAKLQAKGKKTETKVGLADLLKSANGP